MKNASFVPVPQLFWYPSLKVCTYTPTQIKNSHMGFGGQSASMDCDYWFVPRSHMVVSNHDYEFSVKKCVELATINFRDDFQEN